MSIKIPVIDIKGKSIGEAEGLAEIFGIEPDENAVHFVCEGQRFRFYKKNASTKGRASVSGGGKKNRKQKGTGGARQGGNRAPHWVGGGVVFGPKAIKRDYKINKKTSRLALASVLTDRFSGGQVRLLKAKVDAPKTKTFSELLGSLSLKKARVGFVIARKDDAVLMKSIRNIKGVDVLPEEKWTTLDFVKTDSLIFSESALKQLSSRFVE